MSQIKHPTFNESTDAKILFPLGSIQYLEKNDALKCQRILGHGETFGVWETPEKIIPHMKKGKRCIDLRWIIIRCSLPQAAEESTIPDSLLEEGVLWLTRLALLMRLGPAGLAGTAKRKALDASTIVRLLLQQYSKLVALGITRRLEDQNYSNTGFASAMTAEDFRIWWSDDEFRNNLRRLIQLHELGLWSDVPPMREFKGGTTPVRGSAIPTKPERTRTPYPSIPDDYLAAMGPRVIWIIKDLGPNLVHLLETLSTMRLYSNINRSIREYFQDNIWYDRNGKIIKKPPFPFEHNSKRSNFKRTTPYDPFEWPPNHWSSIQALATSLQGAHLWMTLLTMAARISEVATLGRDCIEFAEDGQFYASGKTYKASRKLDGKAREWPIPDILLNVLAQQVKLIEASERLAIRRKDARKISEGLGNSMHLWASLGSSSTADATDKLGCYEKSLQNLARRLGLTPMPGGKNLHPHRFRKTLARLAGLAIDGSQKVLMLLLGHEDVSTTLGYMQADPAFSQEVHDIIRELRILRGMALIDDMHTAIHNPNILPYGGHGGAGARPLAESIKAYEIEQHRNGKEWGVDTSRELSVLLTNNGESARLISAHVVCTKIAGEAGLCSTKKGVIVPGNCNQDCRNRIEDKTGRRDAEIVIPILIQHAQENIENRNWLPLQRDKRQLEKELKRYDDIGAYWRAKPEVQAILDYSI